MRNVLAAYRLPSHLIPPSSFEEVIYFILRKNISPRIPYCEKRLVKAVEIS